MAACSTGRVLAVDIIHHLLQEMRCGTEATTSQPSPGLFGALQTECRRLGRSSGRIEWPADVSEYEPRAEWWGAWVPSCAPNNKSVCIVLWGRWELAAQGG